MIPDLLNDAAAQASARALNDAVQKCEHRAIAYKTHSRAGPQSTATIAAVARRGKRESHRYGHSGAWRL